MNRALFIVGPTAVGKTDLAFKISKATPSILISADSVQVYRGANIISGKDKSVKTYLLDIVSPYQSFSVHKFVERTCPLVEKAKKENKIPIIVGGTGFYIDALFGKIDTISIPQNKTLRERLEKMTVEKLQEELKKLSFERFNKMNNSDANNKRRLIRAIEVAQVQVFDSEDLDGELSRTVAQTRGGRTLGTKPLFKKSEVVIIGLKTSMDNLKKRIIARVEQRLKMGALFEAEKLFKNYQDLSSQLKNASGYKELFECLLGKMSFEDARERWIGAEYKTGKNQMTWFNRDKNIAWFDISEKNFENKVLKLIKQSFPFSF